MDDSKPHADRGEKKPAKNQTFYGGRPSPDESSTYKTPETRGNLVDSIGLSW